MSLAPLAARGEGAQGKWEAEKGAGALLHACIQCDWLFLVADLRVHSLSLSWASAALYKLPLLRIGSVGAVGSWTRTSLWEEGRRARQKFKKTKEVDLLYTPHRE